MRMFFCLDAKEPKNQGSRKKPENEFAGLKKNKLQLLNKIQH